MEALQRCATGSMLFRLSHNQKHCNTITADIQANPENDYGAKGDTATLENLSKFCQIIFQDEVKLRQPV